MPADELHYAEPEAALRAPPGVAILLFELYQGLRHLRGVGLYPGFAEAAHYAVFLGGETFEYRDGVFLHPVVAAQPSLRV